MIDIDHNLPLWFLLLISTVTTFAAAFVKTFQQRNIVFGYKKAAWWTSWVVSTMEITAVGLIVITGWWVILSAGLGGSFGVVLAMNYHEKIFKKV